MDGASGEAVVVEVVERHWEENVGAPDSLLVFLSSGRNFSIRYDTEIGLRRVFDRDQEVQLDETTGLSSQVLNALGLEVWARYAEHQQEVA